MKLAGQTALVTGAASGIGRAIALLLAREGAHVGALDFDAAGAAQTVADIAASGGTASALTANVADAKEMERAVSALVAATGRLDILVANAGINGVWAPIEDIEADEWAQTLDVNLKGTFLAFKYGVPHLKVRGGAAVVVSSLHGTRTYTIAGSTAYACSKGAQVVFTKKMALELAKWKIRVNVICPGSTDTHVNDDRVLRNIGSIDLKIDYPQGKLPLTGRAAQPDEIAPLVLFLATPDAAFITGAEIHIDAAMSLVMG